MGYTVDYKHIVEIAIGEKQLRLEISDRVVKQSIVSLFVAADFE